MDVLKFQRKWIDASRQKERSAYVTQFNDLCALLGVPTPMARDRADVASGTESVPKERTLTNLYN